MQQNPSECSRAPFKRRHRLLLESFAFGLMILMPIGLYFMARVGSSVGMVTLLVVLGVGMFLAVWVE
jgi:hypothetical protein